MNNSVLEHPCTACGGTGVRSRGGECAACKGTGSPLAESDVRELSEPPPPVSALPQRKEGGSNEYYLPPDLQTSIVKVLGAIDLDPASCAQAQELIQAEVWYGPESPFGENGLAEPWAGRVYLNPPGGPTTKEYHHLTQSSMALWWAVLADHWQNGDVDAAFYMGFSIDILSTAQGIFELSPLDFPICVPSKRIPFLTPNRKITSGKYKGQMIEPNKEAGELVLQKQPTHVCVFVYLPPKDKKEVACAAFSEEFSKWGKVRL